MEAVLELSDTGVQVGRVGGEVDGDACFLSALQGGEQEVRTARVKGQYDAWVVFHDRIV